MEAQSLHPVRPTFRQIERDRCWQLLTGEVVQLAYPIVGTRYGTTLLIQDPGETDFRPVRPYELVGATPLRPMPARTPPPETVSLPVDPTKTPAQRGQREARRWIEARG